MALWVRDNKKSLRSAHNTLVKCSHACHVQASGSLARSGERSFSFGRAGGVSSSAGLRRDCAYRWFLSATKKLKNAVGPTLSTIVGGTQPYMCGRTSYSMYEYITRTDTDGSEGVAILANIWAVQ